MDNEQRNLEEQQPASSTTAVSTETSVTPVTQLVPATPETHLPRGIMIIDRLSNSFYKVGLGLLFITLSGALGVATYLWVKGFVSTDLYFKLVQAILELMQNLILV
ncbi:hypothetical protein ACQKL0_20090 [Peribacillus sp. NPDC097264]|uniref:hypothetical protein n=1 Tax=Peribacillus sp. NPDC097264 TaxID=3390616 RepID=UPI003D028865